MNEKYERLLEDYSKGKITFKEFSKACKKISLSKEEIRRERL